MRRSPSGLSHHPHVLVRGLGLVEDLADLEALIVPTGISSAAASATGIAAQRTLPRPAAATTAITSAKARKVRWVPIRGIVEQHRSHRAE